MAGKLFNNTLLVRSLSALVFVVVIVGAVLWSEWSFAALLTVTAGGCLWEFYKLASAAGSQPQRITGMAIGILLVGCGCMAIMTGSVLPLVGLAAAFLLCFTVFITELYRDLPQPLLNIAATLTGVLYAAFPLLLFFAMAAGGHPTKGDYNYPLALSYFAIVWANDTGAYLFGVALGRHRLFERISPKKSWEGFFGGLAVAVATGWLAAHLMGMETMQCLVWAGFGVIIAVTGVWGDLVESMFKRAAGVKDSGSIMPGHGGWLDRFDALLLSLPFAFVYYFIFHHLI